MNEAETEHDPSSSGTASTRGNASSEANDAPSPGASVAPRPSPEVVAKPTRRRFTAAYKLRIIGLADECREIGEVGSLLRGEGLYASQLSAWRKQRDKGTLQGLEPKRRGPAANPDTKVRKENERLRKRVENLERKLERAETIIDFQKKLSRLLGLAEETNGNSGNGSSKEPTS
jgi:transposase